MYFTLKQLIELYNQKIENQGGDENFFDYKNKKIDFLGEKYNGQQIIESYYICFYALAICKQFGIKVKIKLSDSPDILLNDGEIDIPIEVYEAFEYNELNRISINEEKIVKKIYEKKNKNLYGNNTRLLVINRHKSDEKGFNVSSLIRKINYKKYKWNYHSIIFYIFSQNNHKFYYIYPDNIYRGISISISKEDIKKYIY